MSNEVMRILKLLEDGKITSDEASKLINALDDKTEIAADCEESKTVCLEKTTFPVETPKRENLFGEKMFMINIVSGDSQTANITLPITFVKSIMDTTGKVPGLKVNTDQEKDFENFSSSITDALENDLTGIIFEATTSDNDTVRVIIE